MGRGKPYGNGEELPRLGGREGTSAGTGNTGATGAGPWEGQAGPERRLTSTFDFFPRTFLLRSVPNPWDYNGDRELQHH